MKYRIKQRANLLARAIVIALVAPNIAGAADALEYTSASELSRMMTSNELTAVTLVEHLTARIAMLDKQGPSLNAIIELNPDAIEIATALDRERASGQIRGPLHGIPVLLKDNVDTADKMQTSAGSLAMVGQSAAKDAFIVKQLRAAGAIVLGKTNMSEWANVRDMTLPHGWSGRGGQSKNPHVLSAGVCGSSAGSAVAVAAGFAPLTIGTETNGSITCPATANGVVGVKPTLGLFSRSGVVPITRLQDTPGTLTRTVMDAALMFNALQGVDVADAATTDAPAGIDYTALLARDALNGKRIGYPVAYAGTYGVPLTPSFEFLMAMANMQEQGATLVPLTIRMPDMDGYFDALMGGMKHELPEYFASRTGLPVQSLQSLIEFNRINPGHEGYGQAMLEAIEASTTTAQEAAAIIETLRANFKEAIDEQLREHNLDALVSEDDGYSQFSAAVAGYPAITLPSGMRADGMPTSVFFFGTRWSDPQLLAMAYSYEQESAELKHPAFK
ncbi:amidase [Pseudomonas sp. MG-9]|uniref:Amidase family protein n=1 Tax=Pseudomonas serboccidentalis TaxID=2964670 RepID=A0ABY7Z6T6_9PSED|nr:MULTISPECIES: amidase family protein [Pseudomonas]MBT9268457.1 amidase [Pseudomonas sp. MG-9]WDR35287.1 amidase family protein [Pseudomonas serboccidentalis]